jgi:hypothetical protein
MMKTTDIAELTLALTRLSTSAEYGCLRRKGHML